jgi:glutamate:Na+ symporter, ESS family
MLLDISLISALLVVAHLLRAALPSLGRIMMPTSIMAGLLGLAAGPQFLSVLPFTTVPDSDNLNIGLYPGVLIALLFATLLMGAQRQRLGGWKGLHSVRHMLSYSLAAEIGQYGLAILFGVFVLSAVYPGLPEQFSVMLASGFAGGHGTASVFGQGFAAAGWQDALSVGYAFATVGLLTSILGGILLLNVGARCGWIGSSPAANRPAENAFLREDQRFSLGSATTNPAALDPLAWHVALIGTVYGLSLGVDALIHWAIPGDYWIPMFAVAMIMGFLTQGALNSVGFGQYVDTPTVRRVGSLCADYLVVCGIASIKVSVVRNYAGAMVLLASFGYLYSLAVFCLAPLTFRTFWFERSIFTFGWLTGTLGISVSLVRAADPQLRSRTLEDYGAAYLVIGPVEMMLYPAIIWACLSGRSTEAGILLSAAAAVLFLLARCRVRLPADIARPIHASDALHSNSAPTVQSS